MENSKKAENAALRFLSEWDPVALSPGKWTPEDEYSVEARELAKRIRDIRSYRDAANVLREIIDGSFGSDVTFGLRYEEAGRRLYLELVSIGLIVSPVTGITG